MPYYFCIVGTRDNLLYEADLSARPQGAPPAPHSSSEPARSSGIFGFSAAFGTWATPLSRATAGGSGSGSGTPVVPEPTSPAPSLAEEGQGAAARTDEHQVLQMIAHGSLDVLEDKQFVDSSVYVRRSLTPAT